MATGRDRFACASDSRFLTPRRPEIDTLLQCLEAGRGFVLRQGAGAEIRCLDAGAQRLVCETSGTTGAARRIVRRPLSWRRSFELHAERFGVGAGDVYATFGGLSHSLTLYAVMEALHLGADIAQLDELRPAAQMAALAQFGVSVLYATPTQLRLLLRGARNVGAQEQVRLIMCGGGLLDADLRTALQVQFPGADLRAFYGASETSFITLTDADTPPGSVGRAYPGVSIRIGRDGVPPMHTDEIWVSSPYLFDGYEDGAEIRRDGAFVSVGDMGYLDAAGYLFLRGRRDRMVTVADHNVFPEEIETVLMQDPAVSLCAAIAVKDPLRGHSIVCAAEGHGGADDISRLRKLCSDHLGAHAAPRRLVFYPSLPRLQSGKADVIRITQMLEESP